MKLESLKPAEGSVRSRRRLGRGEGSGGGGTSRRGHKGAKSRTGYSKKLGFEGGQMPLQRRVPKFGFKSRNRIDYKPINLDTIQSLFDSTNETQIDLAFLVNHGLADKKDIVKILGRGEISAKVNVSAHAFSKTAAEIITKAGGTVTVINPFKKNAETLEVEVEAPTKMTAPKKADKEEAVKEAKTEVKEEGKAEVKEESKAKEETKEEPKAQKTTKKAKSEGDDLTKIEGIGPKIAELLNESGISTYAQLAAASVDEVTEILRNAGSRFSFHNPGTWGEQAQLAADGKWDELKELQDKLDGGRSE